MLNAGRLSESPLPYNNLRDNISRELSKNPVCVTAFVDNAWVVGSGSSGKAPEI